LGNSWQWTRKRGHGNRKRDRENADRKWGQAPFLGPILVRERILSTCGQIIRKWGLAPFYRMAPFYRKGKCLGQNLNIEFFGEIEYIRKLKDSHCLKILTETRLIISCNFGKIFILKG
jgi:hypothetical protein